MPCDPRFKQRRYRQQPTTGTAPPVPQKKSVATLSPVTMTLATTTVATITSTKAAKTASILTAVATKEATKKTATAANIEHAYVSHVKRLPHGHLSVYYSSGDLTP